MLLAGVCGILILELSFFGTDRTYVGGDGRSSLETRSFESILEPGPEIALEFHITARLGIEIVIDRLQLSQGRDRIGPECVVSFCLSDLGVSTRRFP